MKAYIEPDPMRQRFKVWLYEETPTGARQLFPERGTSDHWEDVLDGELPSLPSLDIPERALEALLRAAEGHVAATDATTAHLKDAIEMRDRLMVLVERHASTPPMVVGMHGATLPGPHER